MSVESELIKNIAKITRTGESELTPQTLLKDIKADSLHWVQIIVGVENALNIEIDIDKERMSQLTTIDDFAKYIQQFVK